MKNLNLVYRGLRTVFLYLSFLLASSLTVMAMDSDPLIIDDGDNGFSLNSYWVNYWAGYQGDLKYVGKTTEPRTASWTFTGLDKGVYEVATTWVPYYNRPQAAPYTILDSTQELATVNVNQRLAPNDFTDSGANWHSLGEFEVTSSNLTVELTNSSVGDTIADAVWIKRVASVEPAPEIELCLWTTGTTCQSIAVGTDFYIDPTPYENWSDVLFYFEIENTGDADLYLNTPISFVASEALSLIDNLNNLVVPGGKTSFLVKYVPSLVDLVNGTPQSAAQIQINNNDSDESEYSFNFILGESPAPETPKEPMIIDDGDNGYTTSSPWISWSSGFQGDLDYLPSSYGSSSAFWTFSDLPAGKYAVYATWVPYYNRPVAAPYSIYDQDQKLGTVEVNQRLAPASLTEGSTSWHKLGEFDISGSSLKVQLNNSSRGDTIADAIRIQRL